MIGAGPAVALRAGPLAATLDGSVLRDVRFHAHEVLHGIYVTVRDRNWGTVPARLRHREVAQGRDGFRVTLEAIHTHLEAGFRWRGRIEGTATGLSFTVDGVVLRDFYHNRIGICVLHPLSLAGTPVALETPSGPATGAFPLRVTGHRVLGPFTALRHPAGRGGRAELRFEGALFETEDQRNWTDASYKSYAPPLDLPFPVRARRGERVRQAVQLRVSGNPAPAPSPARSGGADPVVTVAADPVGPLPALGLTSPARPAPPSGRAARRLHTLRLSHLRAELDLTGAVWQTRLGHAAAEAARLGGVPLEVAVTATTGGQLEALAGHLAASRVPLARLLVFAPGSWVTTGALASAAQDALARHRLPVPLGGGSYAWFTQLNRAFGEAAGGREPPLPPLSPLAFALCPQVHAADETTLRESLATLAPLVRQAREIAAGRPLAIGPVTLRPRFPPTATGPPVPDPPGGLPPSVDPRQPSLLTAGWLVGALARLAGPGVGSLTLFETLGLRGVLQPDAPDAPDAALRHFPAPPGAVFPVWHVLAALGRVRGGTVWRVDSDQPEAVAGLAAATPTRRVVLVANLTGAARRVRLRLPPGDYSWRRLDDRTAAASLTAGRTGLPVEPLRLTSGTATLATSPYALHVLTGVAPPPASRR